MDHSLKMGFYRTGLIPTLKITIVWCLTFKCQDFNSFGEALTMTNIDNKVNLL